MNNTAVSTYTDITEKSHGLTSSALKIIALLSMTSDHTSYIMQRFGMVSQGPMFSGLTLWRNIGRLAFPIYAFMIAKGAKYTHDINKYLMRLFAFALISEIPFDIAFMLKSPFDIIEFTYQNVYFTLFLGLAAIRVYQLFEEKGMPLLSVPIAAVFAAAAYFLHSDYSWSGVVCIYIMYFALDKDIKIKLPLMAAGIFTTFFSAFEFNKTQLFAFAALIPILLYNGKRGRKMNRTFFYAYYPAHLLVIYVILYIVKFVIRT